MPWYNFYYTYHVYDNDIKNSFPNNKQLNKRKKYQKPKFRLPTFKLSRRLGWRQNFKENFYWEKDCDHELSALLNEKIFLNYCKMVPVKKWKLSAKGDCLNFK